MYTKNFSTPCIYRMCTHAIHVYGNIYRRILTCIPLNMPIYAYIQICLAAARFLRSYPEGVDFMDMIGHVRYYCAYMICVYIYDSYYVYTK